MPKTEAELRKWVVEYNQRTTHDRSLSSAYGYNRILDTDLAAVCQQLRAQFEPPIRVLDIGCGNGKALSQLADRLERTDLDLGDFEFWGIGVNRYDDMLISDERLILAGVWDHDFLGKQFHLVFSVFAFHYLWHKLEAIEKIHNDLLLEGGRALLHFPGYLVRFGESPEMLRQNEEDGNKRFRDKLLSLEDREDICPMNFTTVPSFSDDDDCALLAEFGHIRFVKKQRDPISFGQDLRAFCMFEKGFTLEFMNRSERTYVASHYGESGETDRLFSAFDEISPVADDQLNCQGKRRAGSHRRSDGSYVRGPYHLSPVSFQSGGQRYNLDVAVHEDNSSDRVILICPGACETLEGRVVAYAELAELIVQRGLGAVVRCSDPYDYKSDYQDYLLAMTRRMIEFTLESAAQVSGRTKPKLNVMAYSSSAGAIAALAAEYELDSLLLIAPSHDLSKERTLPSFRQFKGNVRVLVGEADEVVLPQQAFWYYENAESAASREYVEARCCGHRFGGLANQSLFFHAPLWAFGDSRPDEFPPPLSQPSEVWY